MSDLDVFLRGYVEAILWANTYVETSDGEAESFDAVYLFHSPGEWWNDTPVELDEARDFFAQYENLMRLTGETDFAKHGHDFALTRNRHGAGFWDRGYGATGDVLTDLSYPYGEHVIYLSEES